LDQQSFSQTHEQFIEHLTSVTEKPPRKHYKKLGKLESWIQRLKDKADYNLQAPSTNQGNQSLTNGKQRLTPEPWIHEWLRKLNTDHRGTNESGCKTRPALRTLPRATWASALASGRMGPKEEQSQNCEDRIRNTASTLTKKDQKFGQRPGELSRQIERPGELRGHR
jgi:hypothetical protein